MTTSGTTAFNPTMQDCVEEAFERCGAELRTGYDLRTSRRSLNLLLAEWANRGINLWTIDSSTIAMVAGTAAYNLPVDTVDLIDFVIRTGTGLNQQDIAISRISVDTYSSLPNKTAQGRPIQIWINRKTGQTNASSVIQYPTVTFWPVPDQDDYYTFVYWRLRRMEDAGNGDTNQDVPFRFIPALIAGLAYHLSLKIPGAMERTPMLKAMYDEAWQEAADEDREKTSMMIVPRIRRL